MSKEDHGYATYLRAGAHGLYTPSQWKRKPTTMRNILSVYTPPIIAATTAPEPSPAPAEVCLKLTQIADKILLEIVDPDTGDHMSSGNLLNIYPDGTFIIIPGAKFGDNEKRGFKNRNAP